MTDLSSARALAERVRVEEDRQGKHLESHELQGRSQHKDSMLRHGLLISESVTPEIERRISEVCERLLIPRSAVTAFVYNSAEVQADCLIDSHDSCVLRFTSGLINLMDEKEFQFVAGHELGHFLLGHGACSQYISDGSSEGFMTQRARELSADRIGFLGVDNLDESVQAIIKTASGLGDQFLRFDVSSFLSQTDLITNPSRGESKNSTHPSMLVRCRSLLWFSMSIQGLEDLKKTPDSVIQEVDKKVTRDLERFVDGQIRARKKELSDDITLWKSCVLIINEGSFKKDVQERFSDELGITSLNGLKSFFESHSKDELPLEASKRLDQCTQSLYKEFPSTAEVIETDGVVKAYEIVGINH